MADHDPDIYQNFLKNCSLGINASYQYLEHPSESE